MIGYLDTYRSPLPKKKVFEILYPGERRTAGMQRKILGSWKHYSGREFSGFFSVNSDKFLCFPVRSIRKSSEKFQAETLLPCSRFSRVPLQDHVPGTIALGIHPINGDKQKLKQINHF